MFLTEFPDLQWLKHQAEKKFADGKRWKNKFDAEPGWPTVVLNVKSGPAIRDDIRGPLSLFTNFAGESHVSVNKRSFRVTPGFFFTSNHDQYYTLEIGKGKAETCNIHIGEHLIDQAWQACINSPKQLLEKNFDVPEDRIEFSNQLTAITPALNHLLRSICNENDSILSEEKMFQLMQFLFSNRKELIRRQYLLPATKKSTREEIMKRLYNATDYIYSNLEKSFDLDDLSRQAHLSKFHFLRLFNHAFGKTPHQFINELKIERAKILLSTKSVDIKEVARQLGYVNASSFSRMFVQQVGVYPTQFAQ
jgi:AraC family transcriptional regulator